MTGPETGSTTSDEGWAAVLRSIIELSTEERNLRAVVRRAAVLVARTIGADACFVHVVDHEAGGLVLAGAMPESFDRLAGTIRLRIGEGVAGWVAERGQPAHIDDKWTDARYVYIPALRGEDFASMISVPMLRPVGVVVGVLNVHAHDANHFSADDLDRLSEVAGLLAGIVENAVLYDRLANRERQLEQFAARTIEGQEIERRRIAGDIHDGISQRLVSASYHLSAARSLSGPGEVLGELQATSALLADALDEARQAIVGLRPSVLDDLGLAAGITSLVASLGAGVRSEVDIELESCPLPAHVETALYRIVQEALRNIVKHAGASAVHIVLTGHDGSVRLSVRDDGVGFDAQAASRPMAFGLVGLAERAALVGAHLEVTSGVGQGTTITVTLSVGGPPLPDPDGQLPALGPR
ncbi:MAG: GAF domain-containing sensor histidine kinase [Actinomycetota bacterium]|nr:GAF domain-containing sensor histidine kinase [Actinomycetota bacterium]